MEGWPLAGAEVTYTVVLGGGSIEGSSAVTDADGYAESGAWTLGPDGAWTPCEPADPVHARHLQVELIERYSQRTAETATI